MRGGVYYLCCNLFCVWREKKETLSDFIHKPFQMFIIHWEGSIFLVQMGSTILAIIYALYIKRNQNIEEKTFEGRVSHSLNITYILNACHFIESNVYRAQAHTISSWKWEKITNELVNRVITLCICVVWNEWQSRKSFCLFNCTHYAQSKSFTAQYCPILCNGNGICLWVFIECALARNHSLIHLFTRSIAL